MSHITTIAIQITSLTALDAACSALGLELVPGQTKHKYFGSRQGDCLHAIRIPGRPEAYEIGVVNATDGSDAYALHWDDFAGGYGLVDMVGQGAWKLTQRYGAEAAAEQMRAEGYNVEFGFTAEGDIELNCYA